MSFEDLWMYIKKGATPDTLSRSALLVFRKKAKSFKIEKGILYYFPPGDGKRKPRKVLRTEKEKQEAIKKAHLGNIVRLLMIFLNILSLNGSLYGILDVLGPF